MEDQKSINYGSSLLTIQAMLEVCISMQSQIIAKLENRDSNEIFKKAIEHSAQISKELFEALPK